MDVRCYVFTPLEARKITGLSLSTLMRKIEKGEIRCGRLPDGTRRLWREDIVRLGKEHARNVIQMMGSDP